MRGSFTSFRMTTWLRDGYGIGTATGADNRNNRGGDGDG
jgi:hypothetical protein